MAKPPQQTRSDTEAQRHAPPGTPAGAAPHAEQQSQHGSTGQQRAQIRANLAQHGVQIHEQARNTDRGRTGEK